MTEWLKRLLEPSPEEVKLAEKIKRLYSSHDVTIVRSLRGWSITVTKKQTQDKLS